jgi:hypothetical protein
MNSLSTVGPPANPSPCHSESFLAAGESLPRAEPRGRARNLRFSCLCNHLGTDPVVCEKDHLQVGVGVVTWVHFWRSQIG